MSGRWLLLSLMLSTSAAAQTCPQDRALPLELDGRKSAILCSGEKEYEYERLDEAGRFHVVRTRKGDDFFYTLVLQSTGEQIEVPSTPIWATDKVRFVTVGCSLQPPRNAIRFIKPVGSGLQTEAEFELPCERESCLARWTGPGWLTVICTPRGDDKAKGTEFSVLLRAGTWARFGR
jgi:hypothetical protein